MTVNEYPARKRFVPSRPQICMTQLKVALGCYRFQRVELFNRHANANTGKYVPGLDLRTGPCISILLNLTCFVIGWQVIFSRTDNALIRQTRVQAFFFANYNNSTSSVRLASLARNMRMNSTYGPLALSRCQQA